MRERGILDYCDKFAKPFDRLFNIDTKIYRTKSGRYLLDKGDDTEEFNPDVLLLPSDKTMLVKLDKDSGFNPNLSTVLRATIVGDASKEKEEFFSLPLSPRGLTEFYNTLDELLNTKNTSKSLFGEYNPEKDVRYFHDAADTYFQLTDGQFAIFFPEDVHAPMIGEGVIRKIGRAHV